MDPLRTAAVEDPTEANLRVYSDALTERADPLGAFIAGQLALEALDPTDAAWPTLHAETARLQHQHAESWLQPLLSAVSRPGLSKVSVDRFRNARFRGGLLEQVALFEEEFDHIEALRAAHPLAGIEVLAFEGLAGAKPPTSEGWSRFKLSPEGWFTSHSVAAALRWLGPSLRHLDLSGCSLGDGGTALLTGDAHDFAEYFEDFVAPEPLSPGQLTSLVLDGCQIGGAGVSMLCACAALDGLQTLSLTGTRATAADAFDGLVDAAFSGSLRTLRLSGNRGPVLDGLAGWEVLPLLRGITVDQTTPLSSWHSLFPAASAELRQLGVVGAKSLMSDPVQVLDRTTHLTDLFMGQTGVGDKGFQAVLDAPATRTLRRLAANRCSLSEKAVDRLVGSHCDGLVELDLSSNKLSDTALDKLAGWKGMAHIVRLRLGNNRKVTATGWQSVIDAADFDPVELDVGKIGDASVRSALEARFGEALTMR